MSTIIDGTQARYYGTPTDGTLKAFELGTSAVAVYAALWIESHNDTTNTVLISPKRMQDQYHITTNTFKRALAKLVEEAKLIRLDGKRGSDYRLELLSPDGGVLMRNVHRPETKPSGTHRIFYDLEPQKYETYYRARLEDHKIAVGHYKHLISDCPFCGGSLEIRSKGRWGCNGRCKGKGGVVKFELAWLKLNGQPENREVADRNIADLMGINYDEAIANDKPVVTYPYFDIKGTLKFRRCKNAAGHIWMEQPDPLSPTGWRDGIGRIKHYLYNLPAVVKKETKYVVITEGESDCDAFNALGWLKTVVRSLDARIRLAEAG